MPTRRLYIGLGLQLRAKTPKRCVRAKLREDRCPAMKPNQTWAMDFVHDQLALGRKMRVLTVVDIFSKSSPAIDPRFTEEGCESLVLHAKTIGARGIMYVSTKWPKYCGGHLYAEEGGRMA
ncbi:MAG: hypothetical protein BGN85_13290 [Alphaproteobacteria bacterium 64-11]|nr:MAG: hypothetical protein BGN85_13290 [Alphaproteobacteria bacterium 64-11]